MRKLFFQMKSKYDVIILIVFIVLVIMLLVLMITFGSYLAQAQESDGIEIKTSSTPLAEVSCCDLKITRWNWYTDGVLDSSMIDIYETISGAFIGRYKFRKVSGRVWEHWEMNIPDTVAIPKKWENSKSKINR